MTIFWLIPCFFASIGVFGLILFCLKDKNQKTDNAMLTMFSLGMLLAFMSGILLQCIHEGKETYTECDVDNIFRTDNFLIAVRGDSDQITVSRKIDVYNADDKDIHMFKKLNYNYLGWEHSIEYFLSTEYPQDSRQMENKDGDNKEKDG